VAGGERKGELEERSKACERESVSMCVCSYVRAWGRGLARTRMREEREGGEREGERERTLGEREWRRREAFQRFSRNTHKLSLSLSEL